jgi:hypothetical protein
VQYYSPVDISAANPEIITALFVLDRTHAEPRPQNAPASISDMTHPSFRQVDGSDIFVMRGAPAACFLSCFVLASATVNVSSLRASVLDRG